MASSNRHPNWISFACVRALPFIGLLLFFWHLFPHTHYGIFFDPDGYMRLLRVEHLIETFNWYESTLTRSNAPLGESSHWSRLLDLLLIAGAGAGSIFTSFSRSLEIWGWCFSLFLLPAASVLLIWTYAPFFENKFESEHWMDLTLITTLSSLDFLLPFYPGRPDHHGLLMLTALGQVGFTLRLLGAHPLSRDAIGLGLVAALGLWISVENLLITGISILFLLVRWVHQSDVSLAQLRKVIQVMTLTSIITLLLERPPSNWCEVEYDKISIFHLCGLAGFGLILSGLQRFSHATQKTKLFSLLSALALLSALVTWIFPSWIHGPMAHVPSRAFSVWLNSIGEVMPVWDASPYSAARIVVLLGLGLLSLRFTLEQLNQSKQHPEQRAFICMAGLVFLILGLLQRRWLSYAFLFIWIPLIPSIITSVYGGTPQWQTGARKIIFAAIPWLILATGGLLDEWKAKASQEQIPSYNATPTLHAALQEMAKWLETISAEHQTRLMAHLDYGPELMYYNSKLEVVATGYHRNASGILDSYDFFHATDLSESARIAQHRGITHVLISRYDFERKYFQTKLPLRSLHTLLLKSQPPEWLEKIKLPQKLDEEFYLFKVKSIPNPPLD